METHPNFTGVGPDTDPAVLASILAANTTAVDKNNEANIASHQGNFDKAVRLHQEALELKISAFGQDSLQAALSQNSLGETYLDMNRLDEAEEAFMKALRIRDDRAFGGLEQGPRNDAAASRDNLARVLEARGKFEEARKTRLQGADKGHVMCGSDKCVTPGGALLSRDQLKACSACRAVFYCGTACQKQDWRARHKPLCKAFIAGQNAAGTSTTAGAS